MRVLVVGAHPDDIELLCAGTLAKFKSKGADIFMAYLCNGDKGHYKIPCSELAKIRKHEAEESARILGAEIRGGYFADFDLYLERKTESIVVDLLRETRPDLVITHSPDDYMADHTTTAKLIIDVSFMATAPNYKLRHKFYERIVPVVFMDTLAGINFNPTEYVNITKFIDVKKKMLLCHQSQYKWLKEHDNIDYAQFMRKVASFRGLQCGVDYAEGFRIHQVWGRIKPERLLP